MAKRFGRNQKRKLRAEVERLSKQAERNRYEVSQALDCLDMIRRLKSLES